MRTRHLYAGARVEHQLVVDMHLEVIVDGHFLRIS